LLIIPFLLENSDAKFRHSRKVADRNVEFEVLKNKNKIHIREISIMSGKQNIDSYWWAIENIDFLGTSYVVITKLSLLVKHGLSLLEKRPVKASTQLFAKVNFT
jgi:hypothetical protein